MNRASATRWCLGLTLLAATPAGADPAKSIFDDDWTPATRPTIAVPPSSPAKADPVSRKDSEERTPSADPPPPGPAATAPAPTASPAAKVDPPPPERQAETLKLVRQIFEQEYAATTPAGFQRLGQRLMAEAGGIRRNQAARYVLLREALQAGERGADVNLCRQALAALDASFTGDLLPRAEEAVLGVLAQPGGDAVAAAGLAAWAADVAELSLTDGHVDVARRIVAAALARGGTKAPEATARLRSLEARVAEYDRVKPFLSRLKADPNDAAAHLAVGKFAITQQGDWQAGLRHLAKGSDAKLRDLAAADLADPADPESQFELAGRWWDRGREGGALRAPCEARAAHWYAAAVPALTDLKQVLARERIAEVAASPPPPPPAATGPAIGGATRVDASNAGPAPRPVELARLVQNFAKGDAHAFDGLGVTIDRGRLKPRTTLDVQRVTGTLSLNAAGSPYLVAGFLSIEKDATLVVEPGTVVLFAPDVTVQNQGTVRVVSDGAWSLLAGSDPAARWKGFDSTGKVELRRCVTVGAASAFNVHDSGRNELTASECVFAGNGETLSFGNAGRGTARNCVFLRNEVGPFGHGDNGKVEFSQCLLVANKAGCTANFYGRTEGTRCTFVDNETAVRAADRGDFVRLSLCNFAGPAGSLLGSKGGRAVVAGNHWGAGGAPTEGPHDVSSPLKGPVGDAFPTLVPCPYLTATTTAAGGTPPSADSAATGPATGSATGAARFFIPPAEVVGTWLEGNGTPMVVGKDRRFLYAGSQPGTWKVTAETLVFTWTTGRVDTYDARTGDTITGNSTIGRKVRLTKSPGK